MSRDIEEQTIRAFVQKSKQERCCLLLASPKRRKDFTKELAHFKWLDERFAHPIPSSLAHTAEEVASLLRKRGAGRTVWATSEDPAIDGTELILEEAIKRVLGRDTGDTVLHPRKARLLSRRKMHSERLLELRS